MTGEARQLTDAWGRPIDLWVKDGVIQNEPKIDHDAIRASIEAMQVKQPHTIAKERARELARSKRR